MSTYNDPRQAVRAALMAGGFSAPQATSTAAIEGLLEQFFEAKLAQALAALSQQLPVGSRHPDTWN